MSSLIYPEMGTPEKRGEREARPKRNNRTLLNTIADLISPRHRNWPPSKSAENTKCKVIHKIGYPTTKKEKSIVYTTPAPGSSFVVKVRVLQNLRHYLSGLQSLQLR